MTNNIENKFKKGKIYRLVSLVADVKPYYGSTIRDIPIRDTAHRTHYKRYLKGKAGYCSSFKVIEKGKYRIELVENYPCNSKAELERREGEIQRKYECCNDRIAGRTKREWTIDNKENIIKYQKEYRANNQEIIKQQQKKYRQENEAKIQAEQKEYYENNKQALKEKMKIYYQKNKKKAQEYGCKYRKENLDRHKEYAKKYAKENKQKIKEKMKKYREDNLERLKKYKTEKVECELCGCIVSRGGIRKHQKTDKCKNNRKDIQL